MDPFIVAIHCCGYGCARTLYCLMHQQSVTPLLAKVLIFKYVFLGEGSSRSATPPRVPSTRQGPMRDTAPPPPPPPPPARAPAQAPSKSNVNYLLNSHSTLPSHSTIQPHDSKLLHMIHYLILFICYVSFLFLFIIYYLLSVISYLFSYLFISFLFVHFFRIYFLRLTSFFLISYNENLGRHH